MSHLHRFYARHAAAVWELEARWMRAAGSFRPPSAIQWIATSACDLTCAHCYSHAGPRGSDELGTDEALALVDAVAGIGAGQLVIAGGEPLLRRDLDVIVERAHGHGLPWALHTHGGLVRARPELFERFPPAMVAVSLDGTEGPHDRLRGRQGSWRAALEAIAWLREAGVPMVVAGTTVNRWNADTLADLLPIVRASGAHAWGLHLVAPEGRGTHALVPTPAQLARVARFARRARARIAVDLDNEWGSAGDLDPLYRDDPFLCGAGRFTAVIAANGDIMPCTTTDPAEAEGNVRTQDLGEVWRTGFARFRGGEDPHARPGRSGPGVCSDGADCWLQTRNGHSCREDAFGVRPAAGPALPDVLPPPPGPPRAHGALRWAAALALAQVMPAAATAAPPPASPSAAEPLPSGVDPARWARHRAVDELGGRLTDWPVVKAGALRGSLEGLTSFPKTRAVLERTGVRPVAELLAVLDELEAEQVWDPWIVGELFGRLPDGDPMPLVPLLARLDRHARVADGLVLAEAEVGPVRYSPWRKKSAPPRDWDDLQIPEGLEGAADAGFLRAARTTWRTEATVELTLAEGSGTLYRAGEGTPLKAGDRLVLARLDVLVLDPGPNGEGNARLTHAMLGEIARGPRSMSGRHGPLLQHDARAVLDPLVSAGMAGDAAAQQRLGSMLPLAHTAIRAAVADRPDAPGAAALRMLLDQFDR